MVALRGVLAAGTDRIGPKGNRSMTRYRFFVGTLGLATLALALPDAAWAQNCGTRHFYNNSNVPFYLSLNSTTGTCSYNSRNQQRCTIPAGKVGEIHYKDHFAPSRKPLPMMAALTVRSGDGGKIYNKSFSVDTKKCYISHNGNTGNIVVNDPANGDIVTCGSSAYACR